MVSVMEKTHTSISKSGSKRALKYYLLFNSLPFRKNTLSYAFSPKILFIGDFDVVWSVSRIWYS